MKTCLIRSHQGCTTFCYCRPHCFYLYKVRPPTRTTRAYRYERPLVPKCQPTQNTFKHKMRIHSISLWHHHLNCYASGRPIFLPCVCFASIYASTVAKSYTLDYMWTAANFIIEGRMRPYGRKLCTVGLHHHEAFVLSAWQ